MTNISLTYSNGDVLNIKSERVVRWNSTHDPIKRYPGYEFVPNEEIMVHLRNSLKENKEVYLVYMDRAQILQKEENSSISFSDIEEIINMAHVRRICNKGDQKS